MLSFARNCRSVSSKCTILHCHPCSYCSTSSPGFGVFSVLDFGDSDRGVMVSPCFFNLHFLDDIPPVFYCWSSSAFYCLLRLNSKWPDWIFILICPIHSLLNKLRFRLLPLKTPSYFHKLLRLSQAWYIFQNDHKILQHTCSSYVIFIFLQLRCGDYILWRSLKHGGEVKCRVLL